MSKVWDIDWFICTADGADVKYARSKPDPNLNLKVGDELWRAVQGIGPITSSHNHWAGNHLDCTEEQARVAAAAPALLRALRRMVAAQQPRGTEFTTAAYEELVALVEATALLGPLEDIKEEDL